MRLPINLALRLGFFYLGVSLLCVVSLWACSIPVFRYALERWPADYYRVFIFHSGPITKDSQKILDWFKKITNEEEGKVNLGLQLIDIKAKMEEEAKDLWQSQSKKAGENLPWVVIQLPIDQGNVEKPVVWSGPLQDRRVQTLVDSPTRRTVIQRLIKGQSAVWVLLESGNKKKDEAVWKLIETELKKMEKELELPLQEGGPEDVVDEARGPKLQLKFSLLKISRQDPKEAFFVDMLLNTEPDLKKIKDSAIVFPIYGRGRALYALVGKGINADTIGEACAFLVGPCSCQVKELNPGTDLVMAINWDAAMEGQITGDNPLPTLPSFPAIISVNTELTKDTRPNSQSNSPGEQQKSPFLRNLGYLGIILLIVVVIGSILILRKDKT